MLAATPMTELPWTSNVADRARRANLGVELGHVVMKRVRWAAFRLLDLRTEFEVLAPGEAASTSPRPWSNFGIAIMKRVRRAASTVLDPWTEFLPLD